MNWPSDNDLEARDLRAENEKLRAEVERLRAQVQQLRDNTIRVETERLDDALDAAAMCIYADEIKTENEALKVEVKRLRRLLEGIVKSVRGAYSPGRCTVSRGNIEEARAVLKGSSAR